jgi:acetyl-CoA carboxylase biotin carboxyl carrier protein
VNAELPLSPEDVADIVSILDRTPYDRFDIRSDQFSLAVVRAGEGWVQSWEFAPPPTEAAAQPSPGAPAVSVAVDAETPADGQHIIRAPLPGTFYRSAQPGAEPFVEAGSQLLPDTVIGIIETMKLMTPVHAGVRGLVVALLVENDSVVDANAALVRVQTAR